MRERLKELLFELCSLDGVSGREKEVRDYIHAKAGLNADEVIVDPVGSLLIKKKGRGSCGKKLMLAAHMDEVGFIIKGITGDGFLKFGAVGGFDRRVLPARRVRIGEGKVPGVIGQKAVHLASKAEREKPVAISDLYIDIGAKNREEAERLVSPGDYAAFDVSPAEFGEGYVRAKAIDDRVGCAVLLSLLCEPIEHDAWFAFTTQEEVGCRGAAAAANRINPYAALIVEGTTAADLPGADEAKRVCRAGGGAVVTFMDGGAVYDRGLYRALGEAAKKRAIPWQPKEYVSGGTDARAIQTAGPGVRCAGIAVPVRNIHSPASVASLSDIDALYRLAKAFIEDFPAITAEED